MTSYGAAADGSRGRIFALHHELFSFGGHVGVLNDDLAIVFHPALLQHDLMQLLLHHIQLSADPAKRHPLATNPISK